MNEATIESIGHKNAVYASDLSNKKIIDMAYRNENRNTEDPEQMEQLIFHDDDQADKLMHDLGASFFQSDKGAQQDITAGRTYAPVYRDNNLSFLINNK